jgi:hypothetical protein
MQNFGSHAGLLAFRYFDFSSLIFASFLPLTGDCLAAIIEDYRRWL